MGLPGRGAAHTVGGGRVVSEVFPPCVCHKTRTRSCLCLACAMRAAVEKARAGTPGRDAREIVREEFGPQGLGFWDRGVARAKEALNL